MCGFDAICFHKSPLRSVLTLCDSKEHMLSDKVMVVRISRMDDVVAGYFLVLVSSAFQFPTYGKVNLGGFDGFFMRFRTCEGQIILSSISSRQLGTLASNGSLLGVDDVLLNSLRTSMPSKFVPEGCSATRPACQARSFYSFRSLTILLWIECACSTS